MGMFLRRAILFLYVAGCSSEETTRSTALVELDSFTVPAGAEGLRCQTFANPFGAEVDLAAATTVTTSGGHHLLMFLEPGAQDSSLVECDDEAVDADTFPRLVVGTQSSGANTVRYPEGVGFRVAKDDGFMVQLHYINASDGDLTIETSIDLELADGGGVVAHAGPVYFWNPSILVPPGADPEIVSRSCTVARDASIVGLTGHMHSRSVRFEARLDDALIYETDSWQDPDWKTFDTPLAVREGQTIEFACTYVNPTTEPIVFGQSIETDAMCGLIGAYYPAPEGDPLLGCTDGDDGSDCLTCADVVLDERDPADLCDDDGPPSSQEIYAEYADCVCERSCATECGDNACAGADMPSSACSACVQDSCAAESDACLGG